MHTTFHLKTLAVAIATLSVASVTNAAGLDRSGQDVTAFFQDGTYAEAVYTYIDADVSGYDSANVNPGQNDYERGNKTGDIAESYDFFRYGVKTDINDTFSVGVLYDEPFGAAAEYTQSNFVASNNPQASGGALVADGVAPQTAGAIALAESTAAGENTNVEVRSQSLTGILGMKFGANKNFQIYGGPVAQRIQSETKLRGLAYGPASGYTSTSNPDMDYGYIAGFSFSKPEIALKAALTYRSEIDHDIEISETYPIAAISAIAGQGGDPSTVPVPQILAASTQVNNYKITTPKSVNFDFQTGINPTTLATAKVRWVPWSDFAITPPLYNEVSTNAARPDGLNLVEYDDDQWQVELGLAKRVAPALAISGTVGWDSGAGDPTTSLGPVDGYYSVGLGAKYNVTENWAVSAGGKYLWFGDAQGALPTDKIVADFEDNDGFIAGVKLSYQGK
ncbi:outer membrane protein transport protein [Psychrobacter sp. Ps1]|uniref:outer membrane protein transport protein n=1 Tax=Psychrobacter sp. Ps1 TaxID=2790955 RepID=UPI001EDD01C3|nr:outer membrane protein transport protein [Psychrobacter sp. Ps1]MCG3842432.1 outer membrane protein transport protein [Psychrobacter sp. Ps1]